MRNPFVFGKGEGCAMTKKAKASSPIGYMEERNFQHPAERRWLNENYREKEHREVGRTLAEGWL